MGLRFVMSIAAILTEKEKAFSDINVWFLGELHLKVLQRQLLFELQYLATR